MNLSRPLVLGKRNLYILTVLGGVAACAFIIGISQILPKGIDWQMTFRPASLAVVHGSSPYNTALTEAPYAGAPWGLLPLIPLALLPEQIGRSFLLAISLAAFGYAAYRLGAKPVAMLAFLLSPPIIHCLLNANLDWMPLLGYVMPPQIGLFFLAIKPQMGSVVAVFWLIEAWRQGGWRRVLWVFGPITLALLLSLALYGLWPLNILKASTYTTFWNASLWPASIPVGLALAVAAIRRRNANYAMAASPCLSPHVLLHSWSAALISIVSLTPETIAAVVGLWIWVILRVVS